MENYKEFQGRDLQDALRKAATELDRPERDLDYEIVSEGRKGWFLGMGSRGFQIRVKMARPAAYETPPEDGSVEILESMVSDLLKGMQMEMDFRIQQEDGCLRVNLSGPDREFLIDPKGEILNAFQFILTRMSRRNFPEHTRILVDSDGFRQKLDEEIVQMARDVADRVRRQGEPSRLPPLNPYERRLVHTALRSEPSVGTRSTGEGFLKRISIFPARGGSGGSASDGRRRRP